MPHAPGFPAQPPFDHRRDLPGPPPGIDRIPLLGAIRRLAQRDRAIVQLLGAIVPHVALARGQRRPAAVIHHRQPLLLIGKRPPRLLHQERRIRVGLEIIIAHRAVAIGLRQHQMPGLQLPAPRIIAAIDKGEVRRRIPDRLQQPIGGVDPVIVPGVRPPPGLRNRGGGVRAGRRRTRRARRANNATRQHQPYGRQAHATQSTPTHLPHRPAPKVDARIFGESV
jgi:hypothetical protein